MRSASMQDARAGLAEAAQRTAVRGGAAHRTRGTRTPQATSDVSHSALKYLQARVPLLR